MTTTGYIDCACRDCFNVAIGPLGAMCSGCKHAGCDAFYTDCQRIDAYGVTEDIEVMREVARAHNIEVWRATAYEVTCLACSAVSTVDAEGMHANAFRRELDGELCTRCPDCGGNCLDSEKTVAGAKWFYWTCVPGCLPDSEKSGPYDTERDALLSATDGLMEVV